MFNDFLHDYRLTFHKRSITVLFVLQMALMFIGYGLMLYSMNTSRWYFYAIGVALSVVDLIWLYFNYKPKYKNDEPSQASTSKPSENATNRKNVNEKDTKERDTKEKKKKRYIIEEIGTGQRYEGNALELRKVLKLYGLYNIRGIQWLLNCSVNYLNNHLQFQNRPLETILAIPVLLPLVKIVFCKDVSVMVGVVIISVVFILYIAILIIDNDIIDLMNRKRQLVLDLQEDLTFLIQHDFDENGNKLPYTTIVPDIEQSEKKS